LGNYGCTMTAQPIYHSDVEHRPRFLDDGLPSDGVMTADLLRELPEDPYWKYELVEGTMVISSDFESITWDDLQTFPDDPHWRYELLEGTLIVTPNAPGLRHQSCALSLALLFRAACPPELQVVIAPYEFKPDSEASMHPDILIAKRPVDEKRLTRAPLLVVEVLSHKTRLHDQTVKRAFYQKHGIQHYWILDPLGPSIEALRLVDGEYSIEGKAEAGQLFEVSDPMPLSFDPQTLLDQ
jgi:Uma2 family endonuclease